MEPLNTPHDKGYKWLLSSREIFLQLLRSFIKESWVAEIDEREIRRADKSFIAKDFLEKEADLVYEANLRGQPVVFYILVELQSKVDFSMPYRLLNYMSGIWQNYLNLQPTEKALTLKEFRLPAIVPIVLYNGAHPWTAAHSFREMLAGEALFGNHLLTFEYFLLDVNRYDDAELLGLSNIIGAAFLLDKNRPHPEDLRHLLQSLFEALQNTTDKELFIFIRWLRYIIQPRLPENQRQDFAVEIHQLTTKEARKMVFANIEKSLDAIEKKGRLQGRLQGELQGRLQGELQGRLQGQLQEKKEIAVTMLQKNFAPEIVAQCTKLSAEQIDALKKAHNL